MTCAIAVDDQIAIAIANDAARFRFITPGGWLAQGARSNPAQSTLTPTITPSESGTRIGRGSNHAGHTDHSAAGDRHHEGRGLRLTRREAPDAVHEVVDAEGADQHRRDPELGPWRATAAEAVSGKAAGREHGG